MIALTFLFLLGAGFICSRIWVVWRDLKAAADDIEYAESRWYWQAVRAVTK